MREFVSAEDNSRIAGESASKAADNAGQKETLKHQKAEAEAEADKVGKHKDAASDGKEKKQGDGKPTGAIRGNKDEAELSVALQKENEELLKEMQKMQHTIDLVTGEKKKLNEDVLLLVAEMQTLQRRAAADVQKSRLDGIAELALSLTETLDNLERALSTMDAAGVPPAVREGVRLTYDSLLKVLGTFEVQRIEPQGEMFDPQYHEAIGRVKTEDVATNRVAEVVQTGYRMGNNRLIRPARVRVAE